MSETTKLVRLNTGEASKEELTFLSILDTRIIGQAKGKAAAARAIRRARNRLRSKRGPIYRLLQIGKSRTGKTLTAEMAAFALHGDPEAMVKVECENYKQPHQIQQLLGAPPSYVGYKDPGKQGDGKIDHSAKFAQANLIASRKGSKTPITIILLDEIEKASDEFLDVLLGIFDTGKIALGNNTEVDFTDCIFFMTSNLGMEKVENLGRRIGFRTEETTPESTERDIQHVVDEELKRRFKPEFLKRINEVVIFAPLTNEQLRQVVNLEIDLLKQRVFESLKPSERFGLDVQQSAKDFILKLALSDHGGVAEIKQVLDQHISDMLGNELEKGTIKGGNKVIVSHEAGADRLSFDVDTTANVVVNSTAALQTKSDDAVKRDVVEVLREVAAEAVEKTLPLRSYISEGLNVGTFLNDIAARLGKQPKTTKEALEMCFESGAVSILIEKAQNNYWLWRMILAASLEAKQVRITSLELVRGIQAVRKKEGMLESYADYKTSNVTQAELTARGLLLIGVDKDKKKTLYMNKLFS